MAKLYRNYVRRPDLGYKHTAVDKKEGEHVSDREVEEHIGIIYSDRDVIVENEVIIENSIEVLEENPEMTIENPNMDLQVENGQELDSRELR